MKDGHIILGGIIGFISGLVLTQLSFSIFGKIWSIPILLISVTILLLIVGRWLGVIPEKVKV